MTPVRLGAGNGSPCVGVSLRPRSNLLHVTTSIHTRPARSAHLPCARSGRPGERIGSSAEYRPPAVVCRLDPTVVGRPGVRSVERMPACGVRGARLII
jgi:hypothetical protein